MTRVYVQGNKSVLPETVLSEPSWIVNVSRAGETVTVTYHWSLTVYNAVCALALLGGGLAIIYRGGPKKAAALLLFFGVVWAAASLLVVPFSSAVADGTSLTVRQGILGRGSYQSVDMQGVNQIIVTQRYETERSGGKKKTRTRRLVTRGKFTTANGDMQRMRLSGELRGPAAAHLLALARERGVTIDYYPYDSETQGK